MGNEAPLVDAINQTPTSSLSSSSSFSPSSTSLSSKKSPHSQVLAGETPPRKLRSLRDIYKTTQVLCVFDPTSFEEAIDKE